MVLLQGFHEKGSEIIVIGGIHGVTAHARVRHHDPACATAYQSHFILLRQRVEISLVK